MFLAFLFALIIILQQPPNRLIIKLVQHLSNSKSKTVSISSAISSIGAETLQLMSFPV